MQKPRPLIEKLSNNPHNVKFSDLQKLCRHFFGAPRQSGSSHEVYKTPWSGDPRVNIQNKNGQAKPEQVRSVLKAIAFYSEEYGIPDE